MVSIMMLAAKGDVTPVVYFADGNTPLEFNEPIGYVYRDIMVGTKLSIFIESNSVDLWNGALFLVDSNSTDGYGALYGRDLNDVTWYYEGSRLPAAGTSETTCVQEAMFSPYGPWNEVYGFQLLDGGMENAYAGKWFVIDYNAVAEGTCKVGFFDFNVDYFLPVDYLVFHHVRSRDFNQDTIVNFADFARITEHWQDSNCASPDWCEGADLDTSGEVNIEDLALFTEFWLEKTQ